MSSWTYNDEWYKSLSPPEKVALIASMEPNQGKNYMNDAKHVIGAMVNSAAYHKLTPDAEVSTARYQPTFEPSQRARAADLYKSKNFPELVDFAKGRIEGSIPDNVNGATNYLAKAPEMYSLYQKDPNKYPVSHWGKWSGFDPSTMSYKNDTGVEDSSHSFIREPGFEPPKSQGKLDTAANIFSPQASPAMLTNQGRASVPDGASPAMLTDYGRHSLPGQAPTPAPSPTPTTDGWTATANAEPAQGAFSPMKFGAGVLSGLSQAFSAPKDNGAAAQAAADMKASAERANAQALSSDPSQQIAMALIRQRLQGAFA